MIYTLKQKGRWICISPRPEYHVYTFLQHHLQYKRTGYAVNPLWNIVNLYQPKRQRFGIGLHKRVTKLFDEHGIEYVSELNKSPITDNLVLKDDGLREYQIEAIKELNAKRGGILSLPTGAGKTRTAIALIDVLELPTLIVVPTLDLKIQWEDRIKKKNVIISTYQGLKRKSFIKQFKLVVFDECHIVAAKTLQLIGFNLSEDAVTIGLSATPMMRDNDNMKIEAVLGNIVYAITLRELIDLGYLVDATVHYHRIRPPEANANLDYAESYDLNIVNNSERNDLITNLASEAKGSVLILVDRIEHGEMLLQLLEGEDVRFINGGSKDRTDLDYRIIIATSIFDMGVDIPRLQTLILAGAGKSFIKVVQRMGRVLRTHKDKTKAIVHDFIDNSRYFYKHSMERKKIFEENFEVIDLDEQ